MQIAEALGLTRDNSGATRAARQQQRTAQQTAQDDREERTRSTQRAERGVFNRGRGRQMLIGRLSPGLSQTLGGGA